MHRLRAASVLVGLLLLSPQILAHLKPMASMFCGNLIALPSTQAPKRPPKGRKLLPTQASWQCLLSGARGSDFASPVSFTSSALSCCCLHRVLFSTLALGSRVPRWQGLAPMLLQGQERSVVPAGARSQVSATALNSCSCWALRVRDGSEPSVLRSASGGG